MRNKYIDHDRAPPRIKRSPLESAKAKADAPAAAPPAPMVKTMRPPRATTHASHTFLLTDCFPINVEIRGVKRTLACVKKDARADAVDTSPTFSNPWAKNPHVANSSPDLNNGEKIPSPFFFESDNSAVCWLVLRWLTRSGGKKQKKASHPRVVDRAAAVGGTAGTS
mmetsp:Transcript_11870/g.30117  ORF Transcript_11870/g.30117 Transcript_11870/m.30117 type:complete len:167 (-) Transcript_11870:508-1008(-)